MSVEEGIGGVDEVRKFWGTPELVEKLITFLDLESIKQLAKSHKLTRQILGKNLVWNQLIRRIFSEDLHINLVFDPDISLEHFLEDFPQHYADLASEEAPN